MTARRQTPTTPRKSILPPPAPPQSAFYEMPRRSRKPLAIDLYAGLGGWTDGLLAEGWDVIGFDVERHDYGSGGYPAQLVLQDVLTLHKYARISYMRSHIIPVGETFGKATVLSSMDGPGKRKVLCRCACGSEFSVLLASLKSGNTVSCGCSLVASRIRHGLHKTPEYAAWAAMIQRCENQKCGEWKNYGARGIKVCAEWRESFKAFFDYIGKRPSRLYSLDRWPNQNGDYAPGNVRWATAKQQSRNTRRNIRIQTPDGMRLLAEVAEESGTSLINATNRRSLGWPDEKLLIPVKTHAKRKNHE